MKDDKHSKVEARVPSVDVLLVAVFFVVVAVTAVVVVSVVPSLLLHAITNELHKIIFGFHPVSIVSGHVTPMWCCIHLCFPERVDVLQKPGNVVVPPRAWS